MAAWDRGGVRAGAATNAGGWAVGVARPERAEVVRDAAEGVVFGYPLVVSGLLLDTLGGGGARACGRADGVRDGPDGVGDDPPGVSGWMDLSVEPVVLSVRGGRVDLVDAWARVFASPAPTAGRAGHVVVGPYWHGPLPPGLDPVRSPTAIAWIAGSGSGPGAGAGTPATRARYRLAALSCWTPQRDGDGWDGTGAERGDPAPPTPPADRIAVMHPRVLFGRLGRLMADNPPAPADDAVVERLAGIGVLAGEAYDWAALDDQARQDVLRGVREGLDTVEAHGRAARTASRDRWPTAGAALRRGGTHTEHAERAERAGAALALLGLLRAPAGTGALEP